MKQMSTKKTSGPNTFSSVFPLKNLFKYKLQIMFHTLLHLHNRVSNKRAAGYWWI